MKKSVYIRKEKYSLDEVFSKVIVGLEKNKKKESVDFNGDLINLHSERYQLFATKGCKCVCCGLDGIFFAKEKQQDVKGDTWHLNLYGLRNGEEILFTKDHIISKCQGGRDNIKNYQVMCIKCNNIKSAAEGIHKETSLIIMEKIKAMRKVIDKMPKLIHPFITTHMEFLKHFEEFVDKTGLEKKQSPKKEPDRVIGKSSD